MRKIMFDESSFMYSNDKNFDVHFLVAQERYVNDLFKARGYIYLNQIYEMLGIKWNPKHRNKCFIYENGKSIYFDETYTMNGFELKFELI